jgi:biotin operon repressor
VRAVLKINKGDFMVFTRQEGGVLLSKLDKFTKPNDGEITSTESIAEQWEKKGHALSEVHTEILTMLKNKSLTGKEIADELEISVDGVRGRISELRNIFGFNIKLDRKNKKYSWQDW